MVRDEGRASDISNVSISRERDRRVSDRRLDSWKEIGAFFGRDERTVKRWEVSRGLPVHRVPGSGRATVYAYASELERWLAAADTALPDRGPQIEPIQNSEQQPIFALSGAIGEKAIAATPSVAPADDESEEIDVARATEDELFLAPAPSRSMLGVGRARLWKYIAASSLLAVLVAGGFLGMAYHAHSAPIAAVRSARTPNPEAQEFFLKGEYYLQKRTAESLNQAVDSYTQAIVRDPSYAQAYAGLADCYNLLREYTLMPGSEAYPRALVAAKEAIALDDSLSGAHSALGFVDFYWLWDAAGAEREFKRAIELDPNSVSGHHWYATYLYHLGRFQQALAEINRAQTLDASSPSILADKGLLLYHAGHVEEGIALLKQLEAAEPAYLSPHNYLAGIYLEMGKDRSFLEESFLAAHLMKDSDRLSILEAGQKGFREAGREGMLRAFLAKQTSLYAKGRFSAYGLAQTSGRLGRSQEALDYLRIAYSRRESDVPAMLVDSSLQTLHDQPEYRKMLVQLGFPPIHDK